MRTGISFTVSREDRSRLEAVISHPSSPQRGHCQSNLTPAQQSCIWVRSDRQLSPFSKRHIAALPEVRSAGEMAIEIEVVVDGSVNGDKFLKRGIASETLHGSLSSSERLKGIFSSVVQPPRRLLAVGCDGAW